MPHALHSTFYLFSLASARSSSHARAMTNFLSARPLAFVFFLLLAVSVRAETVEFPKDNPALSIELPAGWKADWVTGDMAKLGGERLQLQTEGGAADLSIKELPADANITDEASAKANMPKVALVDMKSLEATKVGDVEEKTIAGHKAFGTMVTTGLGPMFYAIFTPDGKKVPLDVLHDGRRRPHRGPHQTRRGIAASSVRGPALRVLACHAVVERRQVARLSRRSPAHAGRRRISFQHSCLPCRNLMKMGRAAWSRMPFATAVSDRGINSQLSGC